MEIKNTLTNLVDPYRTQVDAAAKDTRSTYGRQAEAAPATRQGDRISLSPEAMLRTEAHQAIAGAPEIRQDKVDAIKERIASGTYQADSRAIATKLLGTDAMLGATLKD